MIVLFNHDQASGLQFEAGWQMRMPIIFGALQISASQICISEIGKTHIGMIQLSSAQISSTQKSWFTNFYLTSMTPAVSSSKPVGQ